MIHKILPHLNRHNATQFVTFRTQESVRYYLDKKGIDTTDSISKQQLKLDRFLDSSAVGSVLYGQITTLLIDFFKSKDKIEYDLIAVSVMPNHIHLLFQQLKPLPLIMKTIKGGTAFLINQYNQQAGVLWEKGYFDKIIRDEQHFQITYQYIKNNALSANLKDADKRFYGIYN